MRALFITLTMSLLLGVPAAYATQQTAQQQKMTTCNAQASDKHLSGDPRKSYMQTCLSASGDSAPAATNSQQQKMKQCNADATAKSLLGDQRKQFMSTCLKKQ